MNHFIYIFEGFFYLFLAALFVGTIIGLFSLLGWFIIHHTVITVIVLFLVVCYSLGRI